MQSRSTYWCLLGLLALLVATDGSASTRGLNGTNVLACWDFSTQTPANTLPGGERVEDSCGDHDAHVLESLDVTDGVRPGDGALAFSAGNADALLFEPGYDFGDGGAAAGAEFDFQTGDGITLEALVRVPPSFSGAGSIVSKDVGAGQASWWFRINNGVMQGFVGDGNIQQGVTGESVINDGQWHHVALVRQAGDSLNLYVDYQLDATVALPTQGDITTPPGTPINIGAFNNGARELEGDIQMVRIARTNLAPHDFLLYDEVADLSVIVDHNGEPLEPGGTTEYVVTVSNAGPAPVVGVLVEAPMPEGVSATSWVCVAEGSAVCSASGSGDLVDTVNLPPGHNVVYTVEAELDAELPPLVVYSASLNPGSYLDFDSDDNEDTVESTVVGGSLVRLHVDRSAAAGGNGTSWSTAFRHLQDALVEARSLAPDIAVEIWVARGVYHPDEGAGQSDNSRLPAFEMANEVEIFGGFAGNESARGDRDWFANPTVLSGDIDGNDAVNGNGVTEHFSDIAGNNSYHVVRARNVTSARLDGFYVTAGNADGGGLIDGTFLMRHGGGIHLRNAAFTLANLNLVGNRADNEGGGLYAEQDSSPPFSPHLTDSVVEHNHAQTGGGAAFLRGNILIERSRFHGNEATALGGAVYSWIASLDMHSSVLKGNSAEYGGGISFFRTVAALSSSQLSGNYASQEGGAIRFNHPSGLQHPMILTNMTISGNRAGDVGGGVYRSDPAGERTYANNSIIWNNQDSSGVGTPSATHGGPGANRLSSSHSLLQGLDPAGTGNFDGTDPGNEPEFFVPVNPANAPTEAGNLHLESDSQLLDAGDNQARINGFYAPTTPIPIEGNILVDPDGTERIIDGDGDSIDRIDLGAYESLGVNGFSVGGTVSGLAGTGLQLQNNGDEVLSIGSNGAFTFLTTLPHDATYDVTALNQPDEPLQTCTVSNGMGTVNGQDVDDIQVDCVTETFSVGGTVTGLMGTGLVLQNNGGDDLSIAADGVFQFDTEVADGESFEVTVISQPSDLSQTCSVSNGSGVIDAADITDIEVDCVTNSYTVGGQVTGLTGEGLVLGLVGNDDIAIANNGAFEFPNALLDGSAFEVVVVSQPAGPLQTCSVIDGTGVIDGTDIDAVEVECLTDLFTVGGTVSGLSGPGLILRNNGGDDLVISGNGSFEFGTAMPSDTPYSVTIWRQPDDPLQYCTVNNGAGTIVDADIGDVLVDCVDRSDIIFDDRFEN